MELKQISNNGYRLHTVFTDSMLAKVLLANCTFTPTMTRPGNAGSHREVCFVTDDLQVLLYDHFIKIIRSLTPDITSNVTFELWRDYPFYANSWHYDDPCVQNIMIIYLDEAPAKLGTQFEEDGEIYSVAHRANTGLVLLNSDKIEHGVISPVSPGVVRRTLYVNWKSQR